jgi:hypothetical protein
MAGHNRNRTNSTGAEIELGSHKLSDPTERNMRHLFPNVVRTREGAAEQTHVPGSLLARTEQPSLLQRISPVKHRHETLQGANRNAIDADGDVQMRDEDNYKDSLGGSHTDLVSFP